MNNITGIITTLNEEKNIKDCIISLQMICDEIIVVDSLSSDHTTQIAAEMGTKVYSQRYLGDGLQKNVGLQYAKNKWIFNLDADERITKELADEINAINLDATPFDAFAVKRKNFIGSRWITCCHWYPDYLVRLFNKEKTKFAEVKQHAFVKSKNFYKLNGDILHFTYKNIGEMFAKQSQRFSNRSAKIIYQSGKKVNVFSPIVHCFSSFCSNYFFRGGILGGIDGFSISLSMAVNSYLKYARVLEYKRDKKVFDEEDFNSVW